MCKHSLHCILSTFAFDGILTNDRLHVNRNAEEISHASAKSVRPFQDIVLPSMDCMHGHPRMVPCDIEPIYVAPPGLILGAMHAQLARYKRPDEFEVRSNIPFY
jgi:hypothetical protein